jgi:excisionase family DNA binding protein
VSGTPPRTVRDLTTGEVAKLIGRRVMDVHRLVEAGKILGYRVPGSRHLRFTRAEVDRFLRYYPRRPVRPRAKPAAPHPDRGKLDMAELERIREQKRRAGECRS